MRCTFLGLQLIELWQTPVIEHDALSMLRQYSNGPAKVITEARILRT